MKNKWVLVNWRNEVAVKHIGCFTYSPIKHVWETRTPISFFQWGELPLCLGCRAPIPDTIVLQMKLLNAK